MTVNRWALSYDQSVPNPGAGLAIGHPQKPRSEAQMAVPLKGTSPSDWHPTVLNLAILIVLEMAAYAAFRYAFRTAHGG
jgi:hypothetical protein